MSIPPAACHLPPSVPGTSSPLALAFKLAPPSLASEPESARTPEAPLTSSSICPWLIPGFPIRRSASPGLMPDMAAQTNQTDFKPRALASVAGEPQSDEAALAVSSKNARHAVRQVKTRLAPGAPWPAEFLLARNAGAGRSEKSSAGHKQKALLGARKKASGDCGNPYLGNPLHAQDALAGSAGNTGKAKGRKKAVKVPAITLEQMIERSARKRSQILGEPFSEATALVRKLLSGCSALKHSSLLEGHDRHLDKCWTEGIFSRSGFEDARIHRWKQAQPRQMMLALGFTAAADKTAVVASPSHIPNGKEAGRAGHAAPL